MEIVKSIESGVVIFALKGDLMGGPESESFHKLVEKTIEDEQVQCVADLAQVHWMNSAGVGMLIRAMVSLRSAGGDLRLANLSERLRRPLEITRLNSVFLQYDSLPQALTSYQ